MGGKESLEKRMLIAINVSNLVEVKGILDVSVRGLMRAEKAGDGEREAVQR